MKGPRASTGRNGLLPPPQRFPVNNKKPSADLIAAARHAFSFEVTGLGNLRASDNRYGKTVDECSENDGVEKSRPHSSKNRGCGYKKLAKDI